MSALPLLQGICDDTSRKRGSRDRRPVIHCTPLVRTILERGKRLEREEVREKGKCTKGLAEKECRSEYELIAKLLHARVPILLTADCC